MKPARLLRWYPRAWRERYGEELLALIQDTLDEGRPTWRLRLGVAWGGLRERGHQAGQAGKAAVKRMAVYSWSPVILIVGSAVVNIPWILKTPLPPARAWQATAALDALAGTLAFTSVCVLAGALVAIPAFAAFLREGGWPKIRRRVAWAAGATLAAGGGLVGLTLGLSSMSFAQMNRSLAYFIGVVATALALVVALGLWASAARATAKHLKLAPGARATQLLLAAVTVIASFTIVSANAIWLAAAQSSLVWLVVGVANLALVGAVAPRTIGRALRKGRRLRAAASAKRLSTGPLSGHTTATGLDDLGGGLAGSPVGADRARGLQQQRQVLPGQHLDRGLGGVHGDVQRRDHPALPVPQRRGHRPDARGQLLVGERPAPRADLAQGRGPLTGARLPAGGDTGPGGLGQDPFGLVGRQPGQQYLAE
jgi:hypothetical protein